MKVKAHTYRRRDKHRQEEWQTESYVFFLRGNIEYLPPGHPPPPPTDAGQDAITTSAYILTVGWRQNSEKKTPKKKVPKSLQTVKNIKK